MIKFKKHIFEELSLIYDKSETLFLYKIILEHVTELSYSQLFFTKRKLSVKEEKRVFEIVDILKARVPIQYVLNKAFFYGLEFYVDSNVLIPRPETEELVEWIINDFGEKEGLNILDIGTGSGCIAVSLAKHLKDADVVGLDKFADVLAIVEKNATLNEVEVDAVCFDVLSDELSFSTYFDIIVSNPPYIPFTESRSMESQVVDNEPNVALFVADASPILFYEKIADIALSCLSKKGVLYFEIHKDFGNSVSAMLIEKGFNNVELRKDISNNDRMIRASLV